MEGVLPSPDRHEGHCPSPTRTPCPTFRAQAPFTRFPPPRLQPTLYWKPSGLPQPSGAIPRTVGIVPPLPSHNPASLLPLCRPHSVGGHPAFGPERAGTPSSRPNTVSLGPGPQREAGYTLSPAQPTPLPLGPCSPGWAAPPALDLALGLGCVLPCLCRYMDGK